MHYSSGAVTLHCVENVLQKVSFEVRTTLWEIVWNPVWCAGCFVIFASCARMICTMLAHACSWQSFNMCETTDKSILVVFQLTVHVCTPPKVSTTENCTTTACVRATVIYKTRPQRTAQQLHVSNVICYHLAAFNFCQVNTFFKMYLRHHETFTVLAWQRIAASLKVFMLSSSIKLD